MLLLSPICLIVFRHRVVANILVVYPINLSMYNLPEVQSGFQFEIADKIPALSHKISYKYNSYTTSSRLHISSKFECIAAELSLGCALQIQIMAVKPMPSQN